jgi:hypothetical protein
VTGPAELLAAIETALAELAGVTAADGPGGSTTWSRGPAPFVTLAMGSVEIRVGSAIAAAAVRTPDTAASRRGPDWIVFAPEELDDHAQDRLRAWVAAAHRRASG